MRSLRTRIETAEQINAIYNKLAVKIITLEEKIKLINDIKAEWTEAEADRQIIENASDPAYVERLKMIKGIVSGNLN